MAQRELRGKGALTPSALSTDLHPTSDLELNGPLADDTGLTIHVSHLPPGTSKWNKIEHRMFGQITINWRGKPLRTLESVVGLIANTTTRTGLKVRAAADQKRYKTGRKISDAEMKELVHAG